GASPVIVPQFAPPMTEVPRVTVRATVSAELSMMIASEPDTVWMDRAPMRPWTLPALPTLMVSTPPAELRPVATPVPSTLTVLPARPVLMFTADVSPYLEVPDAGASPTISPQVAPPETKVLRVAVRATVSAESSTLSVVRLGGFWIVRGLRRPWT